MWRHGGGAVLVVALWAFGSAALASPPSDLIAAARSQVGVTQGYDPSYRRIDYPGGDPPVETGVCADVLIRAFRPLGLDLQQAVHEDMRRNFHRYPKRWGLKTTDRNIDHRRVLNLMTWFKRQGWSAPVLDRPADYRPGDIVAWDLNGKGLTHIGILSDCGAAHPCVVHNIGAGAREEDILFRYEIIGHYRPGRW